MGHIDLSNGFYTLEFNRESRPDLHELLLKPHELPMTQLHAMDLSAHVPDHVLTDRRVKHLGHLSASRRVPKL